MQTYANTTPANPGHSRRHQSSDRRVQATPAITLVQLDPRLVVRGVRSAGGLVVNEVTPVGQMREICPHCQTPLQLVLRYKDVIRSHLYCDDCTRCFDPRYPDGSSALALPAFPIE
jgi:hypothetical protein